LDYRGVLKVSRGVGGGWGEYKIHELDISDNV
jgi:hypothetical protein